MPSSGGLDSEESTCNEGDLSSDPWVGKNPWRRNGPTPIYCLEDSHGMKTWRDYSHQVHKELDTTRSTNTFIFSVASSKCEGYGSKQKNPELWKFLFLADRPDTQRNRHKNSSGDFHYNDKYHGMESEVAGKLEGAAMDLGKGIPEEGHTGQRHSGNLCQVPK